METAPKMTRSEQIHELGAALAKAQGQIKAALRDRFNSHLKSKFADLASVWDACREALSSNGLAVVQVPNFDAEAGMVTVESTLVHASGQWWGCTLTAPPATGQATPIQLLGSTISYLRRFALMSLVGIATEDDDDGENAADTAAQLSSREAPPARNDFAPKLLDEMLIAIRAVATVADLDELAVKLNQTRWQRAADRNSAREAFNKRRAELLEIERAPCGACNLVGKHVDDCPNHPKNSPGVAPRSGA